MSCYNIPCLTVKFLHIWTFRSCLNSVEADQTAEEDSDHGLYFLQFLHYVLYVENTSNFMITVSGV